MAAPRLLTYLEDNDVPFEVREHQEEVHTAQEVGEAEHVSGWDVAKPVLLMTNGELLMAVLPAPVEVDFAKARQVIGGGVRLAEEQEFVPSFPDCEVGAEPAFGNIYGLRVLLDRKMRERERMLCRDGSRTGAVVVSVKDFVRLVKPRIVDISTNA